MKPFRKIGYGYCLFSNETAWFFYLLALGEMEVSLVNEWICHFCFIFPCELVPRQKFKGSINLLQNSRSKMSSNFFLTDYLQSSEFSSLKLSTKHTIIAIEVSISCFCFWHFEHKNTTSICEKIHQSNSLVQKYWFFFIVKNAVYDRTSANSANQTIFKLWKAIFKR